MVTLWVTLGDCVFEGVTVELDVELGLGVPLSVVEGEELPLDVALELVVTLCV